MSHIPYPTSSNFAIIVAGGSGSRMQSPVPKQFLLLRGRPVLMHTIKIFYSSVCRPQIIVVLHPDFHTHWQQLCTAHRFAIPHKLINGGETRFHSVKNGLDIIPDDPDTLVAVHDAVRPLTTAQVITESYKHASVHGNAVTAVKSRDSIRQLKNDLSVSLLRDEIYIVQTPQTFRLSQIKEAYKQPFSNKFTDDASVVEQTGIAINLIHGSYQNIKITFPEDLAIAELLMAGSL